MPDPLSSPPEPDFQKRYTDTQIVLFVIALCVTCAFLLALFSFVLQGPQTAAKEFDQSKQMLIAAKILSHSGQFQLLQPSGEVVSARFDDKTKTLVEVSNPKETPLATEDQIKQIAKLRIRPLLTDKKGSIYTLEEKKLTLADYLTENKKTGYANLPLKLFYAVLPNDSKAEALSDQDLAKDLSKADLFILPVSGFGLWAPIYGFIAVAPDGDKVIGTTWYEHGETPGLGANITAPWWQNQFYGKEIFQESPDGTTDFKSANIGIIVVKGRVLDVYGNSPKAKSAVDGMSGATLTGDGVTQAYQNSLTPYRPFFTHLHELNVKSKKPSQASSSQKPEQKKS